MNVNRRLTLLGVMLVVLSMTMATQYATTKIDYEYSLVHPTNADIRFIGYDNSTDDVLVIRVDGDNSSGNRNLKIRLGGNFTENQNKTYTAAFGIVNEEIFKVNITNISVCTTGTQSDYLQIWVHSTPHILCENEPAPGTNSVMVWDKGSLGFDKDNCVWQLAAGDQDAETMDGGNIETPWEGASAHMRYATSNIAAVNGTDDYVWVQISVNIPDGATAGDYSGQIYVNMRADTQS